MLISLVAIAVIAPHSAELGIVLDKEVYAPGETVRVDFVIENKGKEPFTVASTRLDPSLHARLHFEVWCGDRRYWPAIEETSNNVYQVGFSNEVTSDAFAWVYPEGRANVGWYEFRAAADRAHSGLKADPHPVARPFAPGEYEIRGLYKFVGPFDQYDFTSRAKAMFDSSFKGELRASKTFRIVK